MFGAHSCVQWTVTHWSSVCLTGISWVTVCTVSNLTRHKRLLSSTLPPIQPQQVRRAPRANNDVPTWLLTANLACVWFYFSKLNTFRQKKTNKKNIPHMAGALTGWQTWLAGRRKWRRPPSRPSARCVASSWSRTPCSSPSRTWSSD